MKLESHIKNIRQQLDVEKPDTDSIWIGISQSLNEKPKQQHSNRWKYALAIATSVVVLFAAGYFTRTAPTQQLIFVNLDPTLARQEAELVGQIKTYSKRLQKSTVDLNTLPTTPDELEDIDRLIEIYSADLKKHGSNPQIVQSLIDLYSKKVLVLRRMLNEIEKMKAYENNKINI
ncbi:MAG: hypothetical protein LBG19_08490 [Prevotellaceae bacterium]|jgi:hypothetical protein|nr:hypothetical protein [Prevotellaceae bacterium]